MTKKLNNMKVFAFVRFTQYLIVCTLSACNSTSNRLPEVKGTYHPINQVSSYASASDRSQVFNLKFKGTIHGALRAIQTKQNNLKILSPQGKEVATTVDLNLYQVSLETAIKIISLQSRMAYEIVYKNYPERNEDTVFVKFTE